MPEYGSGGNYTVVMAGPFANTGGGTGKLTTISAPVANWKGGTSPYSQVVAMDDISANSKIDIQLSADQIELFRSQDIAFTVENRAGEVTLVAVGDKPSADCVFQASASEMLIVGDGGTSVICGNTVKTASFNNTGGKMEKDINMNGQSLFGLNAPTKDDEPATKGYADKIKNDTETYVNNAVRTAAPRNLLDNSDFRNPVNLIGKKTYIGVGYTINRWRQWLETDVVKIEDGYIVVSGNGIHQTMDSKNFRNTTYTLAAKTLDGHIYIVVNNPLSGNDVNQNNLLFGSKDSNGYVTVAVRGGSYVWAVLYEGEYTAENLPEYQPKGYGAELAECKRYYQKSYIEIKPDSINGCVFCGMASVNTLTYVEFPVEMRILPTIKWYNPHTGTADEVLRWDTDEAISGLSVYYANEKSFMLAKTNAFVEGKKYVLHYEASAEL